MKEQSQPLAPNQVELFLSGAYKRILRLTIILSIAGAIALTLFWGWRNGLGFAIGAPIAYINLVWLHRGSAIVVERMMRTAGTRPSKVRLMMAFAGRYAVVLILAYVILKSFPGMSLGFMVGLFAPIAAAVCEGIYEAFVNNKAGKT